MDEQLQTTQVENIAIASEWDSIERDSLAWKTRVQSLVSRTHCIYSEEHTQLIARAKDAETESENVRALTAG